MARARNIKPGFFKNEVLGTADPMYTILFEGLWVLADKEGRLEDRPLRIKAEVLPYREGIDVDAMLSWLDTNGFIRRYTVGGKRYILVIEFKKHQNPHKNETESELPPPVEEQSNTESVGVRSEKIGSARADSLNSDSLNSDSLTAVAAAPSADGGKLPDHMSKDELWDAGKGYLVSRGVPAGQAGSFIGGLVKRFGPEAVISATRSMLVEQPAEPKGYVTAVCQREAGQRKPEQINRQEALEQRNREAGDRWAAQMEASYAGQ